MLGVAAINPLYTASGFGVGLLVGTDLLYAAATKSVGTAMHGFNRTVDWTVVRRLATGSVPATVATVLALHLFGTDSKQATGIISTMLGVAVLITAVLLLTRGWLLARLGPRIGVNGPRNAAGLTVVAGAVLGVLVSMSSVGAGALGVTALFLLYPQMPAVRIVGSDIAHAVPLTLLAGSGYLWLGKIDWHLLVSLLSGSIPGIVIGSLIAVRVPERVVRPALACVLVLVGGRLVF
jgi:uncharacterized membrane protein YfcA